MVPLRKTNLRKFVVKSSNPFSSNLFVFANHSEAVSNRPRTMVTPQLVTTVQDLGVTTTTNMGVNNYNFNAAEYRNKFTQTEIEKL